MSLLGRLARLVPTPWAPAAKGALSRLPSILPPLSAPGPIAEIVHAGRGAAPRYVRRHAAQVNGDQTRRRNRKARARYLRLVATRGANR